MFLYNVAGRRIKETHYHSKISIGMMASDGIPIKLKSVIIGNTERVSKSAMNLSEKANSQCGSSVEVRRLIANVEVVSK